MIEKLKDWLKSHTLWRLAIRPTLRVQLEQLNTAKPTVFYLGLPEHGNLGTRRLLKPLKFIYKNNYRNIKSCGLRMTLCYHASHS